ncbi:hypothetical protein AVEN_109798-1 [Araneus ventricosus]|uniref:Uncharacterized protein n=1 Tax=Araneus ventricosus TaxID=182803 RepID=A0A4Y2KI01_ARAVE|nr:hypothetical protein AVEN_109798-1 [Araneus ventricosus]
MVCHWTFLGHDIELRVFHREALTAEMNAVSLGVSFEKSNTKLIAEICHLLRDLYITVKNCLEYTPVHLVVENEPEATMGVESEEQDVSTFETGVFS